MMNPAARMGRLLTTIDALPPGRISPIRICYGIIIIISLTSRRNIFYDGDMVP